MDHRLRDLAEKPDILLVDIIKRPCDQIQILKFVRRFRKTNPFSCRDQFLPLSVNTDCEIIIQLFL